MYYIDEFFEGDDEDEANESRVVMRSIVLIYSSFNLFVYVIAGYA